MAIAFNAFKALSEEKPRECVIDNGREGGGRVGQAKGSTTHLSHEKQKQKECKAN